MLKVKTKAVRAYDTSHMEIVFNVLKYFEKERQGYRRINLNNVIRMTAAATGVNKNIVCRIRTVDGVINWQKKPDDTVNVQRESKVSANFSPVIRHVVREMYLERISIPTLDTILERLKSKKVHQLKHLSLFEGIQLPTSDSDVCVWGITSLYNFIKTIGFVY